MYCPQPSIEHVQECTTVRKVATQETDTDMTRQQMHIARKISLANSSEKTIAEESIIFVRCFTRDDLSDSDSDNLSSGDSSTTKVQARRRRNMIRHMIGSASDPNICCLGNRKFQPPKRHIVGMGLWFHDDDDNDDESLSSLSNGFHDNRDNESFDSNDGHWNNVCFGNSFDCEQQDKGLITPNMEDMEDMSGGSVIMENILNIAS